MRGWRRWSNYLFVLLFAAALVLFARVVLPFLMPVVLSAFLVVLFMPVDDFFQGRLRLPKGPSAACATASVFVVLLLPLALCGYLVSREIVELVAYGQGLLESRAARLELLSHVPAGLGRALGLEHPAGGARLEAALMGVVAGSGRAVSSLAVAATEFAANLFLMAVAMYYFFLDGRRLYAEACRTIPLRPGYLKAFAKEFQDVANAMIYGTTLTGLIQGLTGYVGLLLARVPHPHVWAMAMVAVAFVPLGGTALVWAPLGAGLLLTHHAGQGAFLIAWGVLMVGLADNLLRPRLCGSRLTLHPLLVFLSMFGGFAVFGMMGVLVGPLIASLFMAMVRLWRRDFLGRSAPGASPADPVAARGSPRARSLVGSPAR